MRGCLTVILICISLLISDTELFLVTYISSLEKCLFRSYPLFVVCVCVCVCVCARACVRDTGA
jgi:hypothetical protein